MYHSFQWGRTNEMTLRVNQDLQEVSRLSSSAAKSPPIVKCELRDGVLKPQFFTRILLNGVVIQYLESVLNLGLLMDK